MEIEIVVKGKPLSYNKVIEKRIAQEKEILNVFCREPYTMIQIRYRSRGIGNPITWIGIGFAKCNPNVDEYNENMGLEIALRRAIRDIRKQMEEHKNSLLAS